MPALADVLARIVTRRLVPPGDWGTDWGSD